MASDAAAVGTGDYRSVNLANWNERAPAHAASPDYGLSAFRSDPRHLSRVVEFDKPLLGDLSGVRGVHLQCHIGTDTLSLSRLGAHMSGLDFSAPALAVARELAAATKTQIDFHEADVYSAVDVLGRGGYDLVYTGVGALCWLPNIRRWAEVVADLLRPGGRLFIREGHPVLWALGDPRPDGLVTLEYPYFEQEQPQVFDEPGTYVETQVEFISNVTHEWNHGLGEIIGAVLAAGMRVAGFVEHQSVPWDALPGQMTALGNGEWQLTDRPSRLPHSYTLQAVKQVTD
jgi:SAM-dependent methyltransferase